MTDALTTPERSALLALMTMVTAASNADLRERYGFTIDRRVRERLAADGHITATTAARNAYVHELTDQGWARCRTELSAPPADRAHRGYRLLHGVLACLDTYLTATDRTLADFLAPQPVSPDDRVRAAYDVLVSGQNPWVGLAPLRKALPDLSRRAFDDAVLRLPNVELLAEVNQKSLTAADHAAAIHVGGHDKHLLSIRPA